MDIVRPITEDCNVGYDQFNQLVLRQQKKGQNSEWTVTTFVSDVRGQTCSICGHGWALNAESWSDQWYWSDFEELVHESCLVRFRALNDRDAFFHHFVRARVRFNIGKLPNRYWPERDRWAARPWYRVGLMDHPVHFNIGMRKRVVHIEVMPNSESEILPWWEQAEKVFAEEDVTKDFAPGRCYVHAWTREKELEYIKKFVALGDYAVKRNQ